MIEIKTKYNCCGCSACVQICPQHCILFNEDDEGFRYPIVNQDNCIDCGKCEDVCPVIHQGEERTPFKVIGSINTKEELRLKSSSGGVFSAIAEHIIEQGGVVFGVKFDQNWEVVHSFCETIEGLKYFRGSKYVQSVVGNSYNEVESFLQSGSQVLFTGTPCQVAGLKLFLGKEYDNLISIDFICHGVPSPLVWRKYLSELITKISKRLQTRITVQKIDFRDKSNGWKTFNFKIDFSYSKNNQLVNNSLKESLTKNLFIKGFLKDFYLRPSCHDCPSKRLKSGSDITIGDFWGVEHDYPELDDNKGLSLVLIHTNKMELHHLLSLDNKEVSFEKAIVYNKILNVSAIENGSRSVFFTKMKSQIEVLKILNQMTDIGSINKLKLIMKQILKRNS